MARILIVEDIIVFVHSWAHDLKGMVEYVHADTIELARKIFQADKAFDLIVMDCCVPGGSPNTMELVQFMKLMSPKIPILANSGEWEHRQTLLQAGATHEASKDWVPREVINILELWRE